MGNDLAAAIVGHLVGEFILQSDWMARNKKQQSLPCLVHCLIYSICVRVFAEWDWFIGLFIFTSHFALDRGQAVRGWMNIYQKNFAQHPFLPWSPIIIDQSWHIIFLWIAWRFMV